MIARVGCAAVLGLLCGCALVFLLAGGRVVIGAEKAAAAIAAPAAQAKCPYTDTMEYSAGFYSTGSGYWGGQWGGYHLGVDFVGPAGAQVYAPFSLSIEDVSRYDDPGRYGAFIQGRFDDGTLFYAGHLIDVFVQEGTEVRACTVIGTLGATAGPHTHIKLAGPSAPVPCEGAEPGPYGCIDPIAYWEAR
jgi:murein DD-endopeptidase MepM/ murein hydrolase activator NlpD